MTSRPSYPVARLDYTLPPELIAQQPPRERTAARLLHVDAASGRLSDSRFERLPELLPPQCLIVLNDSRVIPARLFAQRATGGRVELLFLRYLAPGRILALVGSRASLAPGQALSLPEGWLAALITPSTLDGCEVELRARDGSPPDSAALLAYLEQHGQPPLPPYIKRPEGLSAEDRERYQTVYAGLPGSVAAPTAGLHFDAAMLNRLRDDGHQIRSVTLHVGPGTFAPLRVDDLAEHVMHSELYSVLPETAQAYFAARESGRPVLAVGTTSLRVLHTLLTCGGGVQPPSAWQQAPVPADSLVGARLDSPYSATANRTEGESSLAPTGETAAFIYPGQGTEAANLLLTNFHLPRSTLLALVYAFGGEELLRRAYAHAIAERYRFFSYGDCMLIRRG